MPKYSDKKGELNRISGKIKGGVMEVKE